MAYTVDTYAPLLQDRPVTDPDHQTHPINEGNACPGSEHLQLGAIRTATCGWTTAAYPTVMLEWGSSLITLPHHQPRQLRLCASRLRLAHDAPGICRYQRRCLPGS